MGTRVPVQHYNLNSPTSFIESPLHVLNTVESRTSDMDDIEADVDREAVTEDSLDNDNDTGAVDCMHEPHRNSLPLHNVEVEEDRSSLENNDSSRGPYDILTIDVNDVNIRLASLNGVREKTIGVALEAAGGLYRRLAKKFPKRGPCTYKRRELATSVETRTRFPELVIQEEKRVRFVVVNGLNIVEKPETMPIDDAEWFKRLTGRHEVAISARDYKFYSPRHKFRRAASNMMPNVSGLPSFPGADNSSALGTSQGFRSPPSQQQTPCKHHMQSLPHQPQFHPVHQNHHQTMHQSQQAGPYSHNHHSGPSPHLSEISHAHQSPTISQQLPCLQPLTSGHVGGRVHILPSSPAKFCDECGAPFVRETSKFCSECGSKRFGT